MNDFDIPGETSAEYCDFLTYLLVGYFNKCIGMPLEEYERSRGDCQNLVGITEAEAKTCAIAILSATCEGGPPQKECAEIGEEASPQPKGQTI